MKKVLLLVVNATDPTANQWVESLKREPEHQVERFDLDRPEVDYRGLVCRVFAADSVWTIQPPNP